MACPNCLPLSSELYETSANCNLQIFEDDITFDLLEGSSCHVKTDIPLPAAVSHNFSVSMISASKFKLNVIFYGESSLSGVHELLFSSFPYKPEYNLTSYNFNFETSADVKTIVIRVASASASVAISNCCLQPTVVAIETDVMVQVESITTPGTTTLLPIDEIYAGVHRVYIPATNTFTDIVHNYYVDTTVDNSCLLGKYCKIISNSTPVDLNPTDYRNTKYFFIVLDETQSISAGNRLAACYGIDYWNLVDAENNYICFENRPID
jgi:hypothetical protein